MKSVILIKEVLMNNHERAIATYEALKRRRALRAKKRDKEADSATATLIKSKTRGRMRSICYSTGKFGQYY